MDAEAFIGRWTAGEGGAERANYQLFLSELCDLIGVPRPEPAGPDPARNDYVFERAVRPRQSAPTLQPRRIDLYKWGCFILEAKQSRRAATAETPALLPDLPPAPRRAAGRWDAMMQAARRQAEDYVFLLDPDHPAPPFLIVCDVGESLELYADFTGTGRAYGQFPDRLGFRIAMDDLRRPEIRRRLAAVWTDPASLDPALTSARVTRAIAERLAKVSKALEAKGADPEAVAHFLMRCLFTMFAEDVGLLPADCFKTLLRRSRDDPGNFGHRLKNLWTDMERGAEFSPAIDARVRHFNGGLFADTTVFALPREAIGELIAAAEADWREVDPAIFGTLLEQALDPAERKRLGAHYTPRAYVRRLVEATIMQPLREDWEKALAQIAQARADGDEGAALRLVRAFHERLCKTRVLDPACGTGNFLYVALELMKTLEGEVLEALAALGESERLTLAGHTVDPHQFLGLELNPRAAAIAELVVWIGYLQWHYRNHEGHPAEPILRAFANINFGRREGYDAVLTWDGAPLPRVELRDGERVETCPNPRRPEWPEAEFIVGNPPFLGKGSAMRGPLGDEYVEALRAAHPWMNESADFVMYWWDRAAELLARRGTPLRRFGLVTTNSIGQLFNRRVLERRLTAKAPISLVFAVPDHPWTKATPGAAAVRIAMTVGEAGSPEGALWETASEMRLNTDEPHITFSVTYGRVNADLTVGADLTRAKPLLANAGLSWNGVMLAARGFVLTASERDYLDDGQAKVSPPIVRPFLNGGDLVRRPRTRFVIDFFRLESAQARAASPAAYQHLLATVKPERDKARDAKFREEWWLFGRSRPGMREALKGLDRYIGTTETAKHRLFQFIDAATLPDHMIIVVAEKNAMMLALLSSRLHVAWALAAGGWLGVGNDPRYSKSRCFDPFPFPDPSPAIASELRDLGEELDATRKAVLAEQADLTLTGLYNLIERLRAATPLLEAEADAAVRGRAPIIAELHARVDAATARAYGWPADLSDQQILERLVALNAERAAEEAAGQVRWLRPDYQIPRFAKGAAARAGDLDLAETVVAIDRGLPAFPKDRLEQPLAVEAALAAAGRPLSAADLARGFRKGGRAIEPRIARVLETLALYGRVSPAGAGRFLARRAA